MLSNAHKWQKGIVHLTIALISLITCLSIASYEHPFLFLAITLVLPLGFISSWIFRDHHPKYQQILTMIMAVLGIPIVIILSPFFSHNYRFWFGNFVIWLILTLSFSVKQKKDYLWMLLMCIMLSSLIATVRLTNTFPMLFVVNTIGSIFLLLLLTLFKPDSSLLDNSIYFESQNRIKFNLYFMRITFFYSLGIILLSIAIATLLPRYNIGGTNQDTRLARPPLVRLARSPIATEGSSIGDSSPVDESNQSVEQGNFLTNWIRKSLLGIESISATNVRRESIEGFSDQIDLRTEGEINQNNTIAMVVRSNYAAYSRAIVYNYYDGKTWTRSKTDFQKIHRPSGHFDMDPRFFLIPNNEHTSYDPGSKVVYTVRSDIGGAVPTPYFPSLIDFPDQNLYVDKSFTVQSPFILTSGTIYTVEPSVPLYNLEFLATVTSSHSENEYIQLPNIPTRVTKLTHELTDKYPSQLQKVRALTRYLLGNYTYVQNYKALPDNADFVDYFLFESKTGNCQHFASALAVMCRSIGIPTRLVSGFTPGTYNPITDFYEIRFSDAHAWDEIYFQGYGWVFFDATPGSSSFYQNLNRNDIIGNLSAYMQVRWLGVSSGVIPHFIVSLGSKIGLQWEFLKYNLTKILVFLNDLSFFTFIIIFCFTAMTGYFLSRITDKLKLLYKIKTHKSRFVNKNINYPPEAFMVFTLYEDFYKYFSRQGFPMLPGMTPHEYLEKLHPHLKILYPISVEITDIFCSTRYGNILPEKRFIKNLQIQFTQCKRDFDKLKRNRK